MTLYSEVKLLRASLKNIQHWYLDVSCPDEPIFLEIAEKAQKRAYKRLSKIPTLILFLRYKTWVKRYWVLYWKDYTRNPEKYYFRFLNDLAWSVGKTALRGQERDLYEESVNISIEFSEFKIYKK
jgi:hypothetical protein